MEQIGNYIAILYDGGIHMSQQIKAIFENGVFRPLEPVTLEEHQEVILSVGSNQDENLADLAITFFGDQGVELPVHPAVPVRDVPHFQG